MSHPTQDQRRIEASKCGELRELNKKAHLLQSIKRRNTGYYGKLRESEFIALIIPHHHTVPLPPKLYCAMLWYTEEE